MDALLIPAEEKQLDKIIEFLKSLKINFEKLSNIEDSTYSKEFQKIMDKSIQQENEGKVKTVSLDEIWK